MTNRHQNFVKIKVIIRYTKNSEWKAKHENSTSVLHHSKIGLLQAGGILFFAHIYAPWHWPIVLFKK
jgi:hypothetical protein